MLQFNQNNVRSVQFGRSVDDCAASKRVIRRTFALDVRNPTI